MIVFGSSRMFFQSISNLLIPYLWSWRMTLRTSLQECSLLSSPGSQKTFHVLLCWALKHGWNLDGAKPWNAGCSISIVQSISNQKIVRLGVSSIAWTLQRTTAGHCLALEVLEARQQAEPAMYLKLTLYWRNECVFSLPEVLGRSLKV